MLPVPFLACVPVWEKCKFWPCGENKEPRGREKDGPKREEKADTSSEATEKAEPETAPPAAGELWYSAPDGSLSRFDGERLLVALPSENVRVPEWARGVVRRINGREYVVFPR